MLYSLLSGYTKEAHSGGTLMKASISLFLALSFGLMTSTWAQVLEMPEGEPAAPPADTMSFTLPGRGMTKEMVEEKFGSPTERVEAVGEPPITRWVYGNFTVYFEYDHVIHAVLHKH
jgi:hypothetical protein